jgi:hypothetical protein
VHSHTFRVNVTAHYANSIREYSAVVWRNTPLDIRVVGFSWAQTGASAPAAAEEQDISSPQ